MLDRISRRVLPLPGGGTEPLPCRQPIQPRVRRSLRNLPARGGGRTRVGDRGRRSERRSRF